MKNSVSCSKIIFTALVLSVMGLASSAYAGDEDESDSNSASSTGGHWYMGASTGYLKPDDKRGGGNTRTVGVQGGYQFSDKWSIETALQENAFAPGKDHLNLYDLNFLRTWGDDTRVFFEFGATHVSLDSSTTPDRSTNGFHIGGGLSAFITDNWELRGDLKLIQTMNGNLHDGLGTLSLNYHFVEARSAREDTSESVLGSGEDNKSLPPISYREPIEASEPAEEPAPSAVEPANTEPTPVVAEAPAAPPQTAPVAPVESAPVAVVAAPPANTSSTTAPKFSHTLVNFGFNSIDLDAQYGSQLDQISEEIKTTNSKAVIEGNTDNVGSAENNKTLSLDRAIVVKRALKKRGVNGTDLQTVGLGEEHPVATNDTEKGRAQNRRVEVKVYDK